LFCRVIEKREEHQRNVHIYTIPETVPTKGKKKKKLSRVYCEAC